jgi:radical SAM superfamily enzyme YgiQ (UPF0313 family)
MRLLFVVYDNDMYTAWFPQGIGYLAAVVAERGHDVVIYNQDLHHHPDEHLTAYLDRERFDVVGIGVIGGYYQYRKLLSLARAIERARRRPLFVLGGHGPSPEPAYFLARTGADAVVLGEGERTLVDLLDALAARRPLAGVRGIAFVDGGRTVMTEPRPLIEDIDTLPFPAYHRFPIQLYRMLRLPHATNRDFAMPILSGRGCTFQCTFCYRMDEGFRPRRSETIIEEIRLLKQDYGITYVTFSDELLMSSRERTVSLCEDMIRANLGIKFACNGRLNYAQPKVLALMRRAGCVFINYGIEALDDDVLRKMRKSLNVGQIVSGIEATLEAGISPGYNIIFGNLGDSAETLGRGVDFLLKYDDGAQLRTIRPVTPYPGSPLYCYAIEKGLLADCADFYERKHVNSDLLTVNFTDLSDEEFHRQLLAANQQLLENYYRKKLASSIEMARKLYLDRDSSFRGFRQT